MRLGLNILKFSYSLVQHHKRLYLRFNKVTRCFWSGSSRQSLKVREVKCIPGDPTITCPVLFKGSHSPLSLALLYVAYCMLCPYLVRWYLVFCWLCCVMLAGTALYIHLLVCAGLSLFIISGLYVYVVVCIVYAYNLTCVARTRWGLQKHQSWGYGQSSTFRSQLLSGLKYFTWGHCLVLLVLLSGALLGIFPPYLGFSCHF